MPQDRAAKALESFLGSSESHLIDADRSLAIGCWDAIVDAVSHSSRITT